MYHCLHALGHPKLPPIRKLKGSGSKKKKKREKMPAGSVSYGTKNIALH